MTAAVCEFTPKAPELIRTVTTYNEEDVKKAAEMINAAERPIVYFGGGVRSAAGCQPPAGPAGKGRHACHLHPDGRRCAQLR